MQEEKNQLPGKPKGFKGIILATAGMAIVLLLILLGALLAGHVWNPPWNPFKKYSNSDKVIREKILKEIKK
jgi:hypothetical protein